MFARARHWAQLALASVALCALGAGDASAQSRDYDQPSEEYSEFWEQALAADDKGYEEQVRNAISSFDAGGAESRNLALSILRDAIKAKPDKVEAHFWLGQLQLEAQDWEGCAGSLAKAYEIDPTFLPKLPRKNSSLEKNLASCFLYHGDYEQAIHHFQRLITVSRETRGVELLLGEAMMAVGRLDEATQLFKRAKKRSYQLDPVFALAVALDRAERFVESRKHLEHALNRDRKLRALLSARKVYGPAEDEDYYLGLARAGQRRANLALFHFRRYLLRAPDSPWKKRVQQHIKKLGAPTFAADLELRGSGIWIRTEMLKAINAKQKEMRACLAGHPLVLAKVSISGVKRSTSATVQVHAIIEAQHDTEDEALDTIVTCLETQGRSIKAPKLAGSNGSHSTAAFTILGE